MRDLRRKPGRELPYRMYCMVHVLLETNLYFCNMHIVYGIYKWRSAVSTLFMGMTRRVCMHHLRFDLCPIKQLLDSPLGRFTTMHAQRLTATSLWEAGDCQETTPRAGPPRSHVLGLETTLEGYPILYIGLPAIRVSLPFECRVQEGFYQSRRCLVPTNRQKAWAVHTT